LYDLTKKEWTLLLQEERYKKYAVVGRFDDLESWVLLGDSKGQARLFNVDSHEKVEQISPPNAKFRHLNGRH